MTFGRLLRHRVTVQRPADAPPEDEWGQPTLAPYADVATDVPALIQEGTGRQANETPESHQQGAVIRGALIFLPWGTDVTTHDRLHRAATGDTWEVQMVVDAGGQGRHLELQAERVQV